MRTAPARLDDVVTPRELARAAGASEEEVRALIRTGAVRTCGGGAFIRRVEALRAGRQMLAGRAARATEPAALFSLTPGRAPSARMPFGVSGLAHAVMVAGIVAATTLGLGRSTMLAGEPEAVRPARLVFVALPGPGGGGGGGGLRQPQAPRKARRQGTHSLASPLPVRRAPERPKPAERPPDPEPPRTPPEPLPPVVAPVVAVPADPDTRAGVLEDTSASDDSRGPGRGGGRGTGDGTGLGNGEGGGIGEGIGGGTGGGPYGPGSGIEPPVLLREVKPDYTEEARRLGIEGVVILEIVVRRDGSVGDVRLVQGLGHGLDARAVQAVRQWRFTPAHRRGAAVDLMVEVAMEFEIR